MSDEKAKELIRVFIGSGPEEKIRYFTPPELIEYLRKTYGDAVIPELGKAMREAGRLAKEGGPNE